MLRSLGLAVLGAALLLPAAAAADPLATSGTRLIGAAAPGAFTPLISPADGSALGRDAVSEDGSAIAFSSRADGLSDADDDTKTNVYVKDMATGAITLVSRRSGADGAADGDNCDSPSISDNGMRVAFVCSGSLDAADTNADDDVYVRDLATDTTILVSAKAGVVGNDSSDGPDIAGNGGSVAFQSRAGNFAGLPSQHVYWRQIGGADALKLVDAATAGNPNGTGSDPSISDSGTLVAFASLATNLVDNTWTDTNASSDVFVRDVSASTTVIASARKNTKTAAAGASRDGVISGDGTAVAFDSNAGNFGDGDTNAAQDVHLRTLSSENVRLISQRTDGTQANGYTYDPVIDDGGTRVAFINDGGVLSGIPAPAVRHVYLRDLTPATPTTVMVSRATGAAGAPNALDATPASIAGDGNHVAFATVGLTPDSDPITFQVFSRNVATATTAPVSRPPGDAPFVNLGGSADINTGAVSADGRYTVFTSDAAGLPGAPGDEVDEAYRRDNLTGDVALVSRLPGGGAAADGDVRGAAISADGNRIAFYTEAENMGGPGKGWVVDVRDLAADTLQLASVGDGADGAPTTADDFALSGNGNRVAFTTDDPGLGAAGNNLHVFVRDLTAQTTTQVGAGQDGDADRVHLDADGGRVAWELGKTTSGPGGTTTETHAWVSDVGGTPAQLDTGPGTYGVSISGDGNLAAFSTVADGAPAADVFIKNLTTGTVTLASLDATGANIDAEAYGPEISADGSAVAFTSSGPYTGEPTGGNDELFVRNLRAGTTVLASRADGAAGAIDSTGISGYAISGSGGCIAFSSQSPSYAAGLASGVRNAWLRAVSGTCPATAPGPAPTPTPTATPAAHARPVIGHLKVKPGKTFRRRKPAALVFTLSTPAKVKVVIATLRHKGHKAKRIEVLRATGHKGANTIKLKPARLRAGRYRITLTAAAAGGTSAPRHVTIRVKR